MLMLWLLFAMQGDVDAAAGGSASTEQTQVKVSRKTRISDGCDSVTALEMYLANLFGS